MRSRVATFLVLLALIVSVEGDLSFKHISVEVLNQEVYRERPQRRY